MHWGFVDPAGKRVLDIGADWGSTAEFFLKRKAKHVVAVESDKQLFRQLVRNSKKIDSVTPVFLFVNSAERLEMLIEKFKPRARMSSYIQSALGFLKCD